MDMNNTLFFVPIFVDCSDPEFENRSYHPMGRPDLPLEGILCEVNNLLSGYAISYEMHDK